MCDRWKWRRLCLTRLSKISGVFVLVILWSLNLTPDLLLLCFTFVLTYLLLMLCRSKWSINHRPPVSILLCLRAAASIFVGLYLKPVVQISFSIFSQALSSRCILRCLQPCSVRLAMLTSFFSFPPNVSRSQILFLFTMLYRPTVSYCIYMVASIVRRWMSFQGYPTSTYRKTSKRFNKFTKTIHLRTCVRTLIERARFLCNREDM